jgi:phosphocarrier protein HPr
MSSETESKKFACSFIVTNKKGLHARPSTELAKCASAFASEVILHYRNFSINAKSLIGILMLEIEYGAEVTIEAMGKDAEEAVKAITKLDL